MAKTLDNFVKHRTQLLAEVWLTRNNNVKVVPFDLDTGFQLLAKVIPKDLSKTYLFGVLLEGTTSPLPSEEDATRYLSGRDRIPKRAEVFNFPVLVIVCSMENDKAYYTWQSEPIITGGGIPGLETPRSFAGKRLDTSALKMIIERVSRWHEGLYSLLLDQSR